MRGREYSARIQVGGIGACTMLGSKQKRWLAQRVPGADSFPGVAGTTD